MRRHDDHYDRYDSKKNDYISTTRLPLRYLRYDDTTYATTIDVANSKVRLRPLYADYTDHCPQDACTSLISRPSKSWRQTRKCTHEPRGLTLDTKVTEIDPGFSTWSKSASLKSPKVTKTHLEALCAHYIPYSPRIGLAVRSGIDLNPL